MAHLHAALTALEREYGAGQQTFVTHADDPYVIAKREWACRALSMCLTLLGGSAYYGMKSESHGAEEKARAMYQRTSTDLQNMRKRNNARLQEAKESLSRQEITREQFLEAVSLQQTEDKRISELLQVSQCLGTYEAFCRRTSGGTSRRNRTRGILFESSLTVIGCSFDHSSARQSSSVLRCVDGSHVILSRAARSLTARGAHLLLCLVC